MKHKKQAVVVIHGIGNQHPQDTLKEFVENLNTDDELIFSSPDRLTNFYETRRLYIDHKRTDFYEYYWANLMTEPSLGDMYGWVFKLLFNKKPSPRVQKLVHNLKGAATAVLVLLLTVITVLMYKNPDNKFFTLLKTLGSISVLMFFLKFLFESINKTLSKTVGDAVKYLTPSPQNIEARYQIRNKGIALLKKLHEEKDANNEPLYERIIVVGHSLGSIVAYDIITNLWADYLYANKPQEQHIHQSALEKLAKEVVAADKTKKPLNINNYQNMQGALFNELKQFQNPWLISDLLTLGSPLCHGAYLLAKNEEAFTKKIHYRELPLCPPKIELKRLHDRHSGKKIDKKNYKFPFFFHKKYKNPNNAQELVDFKVINHASPFAFVKWTNVFFNNDYVGGTLSDFGCGIRNSHALKPKGSWKTKSLPFWSHTKYWDCKQKESLAMITQVIFGDNAR